MVPKLEQIKSKDLKAEVKIKINNNKGLEIKGLRIKGKTRDIIKLISGLFSRNSY